MKRRDFLKAAPATLLPFLVGGFSIKAFADSPMLHNMLPMSSASDRILVLVQLIGGNDGLQTVVPLDQYSKLVAARPNIVLAEKDTLKITDTNAFHPNMVGMQNLYKDGKIAIVQNVSYPEANYSHFRSMDIWLSGANYNQVLTTGWIGRYLDQEYPGFPTGYPNANTPDPIAIQIGAAVTLGLEGPNGNMGMTFSDPTAFNTVINNTTSPTANTRAGDELKYIRAVGQQLEKFGTPVKSAAAKGKTLSAKWPTTPNVLADQLRIVASLISGGLQTKIYLVNLGGFDSHTDQRRDQDPLLANLSDAMAAFQDELQLHSLEDRVLGMTFSEFGRRIKSNDSGGTDHGSAAPLFLFGTKVIAGMHGDNPVLPATATPDDNLAMQYDFRQIYASVLKEWFGTSDTEIATTLLKKYATIPIIQQQAGVITSQPTTSIQLLQNYPNPCNASTTLSFRSSGSQATIYLSDIQGRLVRTVYEGKGGTGIQSVVIDTRDLPSGTYFYRLESEGISISKEMIVVR
ncbi:MAG: DUF1501 domain-containing protein [bacterium]